MVTQKKNVKNMISHCINALAKWTNKLFLRSLYFKTIANLIRVGNYLKILKVVVL